MAQFYPLTVTEIHRETRDAVAVTLEPRPEDKSAFAFVQGQYLTFRRTFEGEELRRCYSICAGVNDARLRIGVKKVDGGWFSSFVNDELGIGDVLEAMAPMGAFYAPIEPESGRHYLGFAGGSGITPLVSIIKTVLEAEPASTFSLIYGNRSVSSIMFRGELEDLKDQYLGRLSILHVLENESDIDLFAGRLDGAKCEALFGRWVDVNHADLAFICGPEPMMNAVAGALKAQGMPKDRIKFELFASPRPKKAKRKTGAGAGETGEVCQATITVDGVRRAVEIKGDDQSVLEAARAADLEAPYSCRAGVCSTCRAKLIDGEVEMEANYALEDYEVERGYILTCQSYPRSKTIVVDYDQ